MTELEGQTREAFGRTKTAMSTRQQGVASQAERLADLENALFWERQLRVDQKATIERLSKNLANALARVDRLSMGLAAEHSRKNDKPPYLTPNHPPVPTQTEPVVLVQPPHFTQGVEIAAGNGPIYRTPTPKRYADHPGRPRSQASPSRVQRSPRPASRLLRAGSRAVSSHGGDPIISGVLMSKKNQGTHPHSLAGPMMIQRAG